MTTSIWDYCLLDSETSKFISEFDTVSKSSASSTLLSDTKLSNENNRIHSNSSVTNDTISTILKQNTIQDSITQSELNSLEQSCGVFLEKLDISLRLISDIAKDHHDVTSRTNTLIQKCEDLLEQQHSLQTTVESLRTAFQPFNDIEAIGIQLGIPFESTLSRSSFPSFVTGNTASVLSTSMGNTMTIATTLDPRSSEFQEILNKLSIAIVYIHDHQYYHDYEQYKKWLEQLQMRATSLIAKSMRELLDSAGVLCKEIANKQAMKKIKPNPDDQPLESAPIYQKFRGLSYRMRELSSLLHWNRQIAQQIAYRASSSSVINGTSTTILRKYEGYSSVSYKLSARSAVEEIIESVQQSYVSLRCELVIPLIKEQVQYYVNQHNQLLLGNRTSSANQLKKQGSAGNMIPNTVKTAVPENVDSSSNPSPTTIPPPPPTATPTTGTPRENEGKAIISHVGSNLSGNIRKAYTTLIRIAQLEYQLFESLFRKSSGATSTASGSSDDQIQDISEVSSIIQSICNATNDSLRPLIIHESDLDELCKVVNILAEDLRSQILAATSLLHKTLLAYLIQSLDYSISDTQERLSYCAEVRLRQDIQLFEPKPSQLAYPDILESQGNINQSSNQTTSDDVSKTWYPSLKSTLALLSKLYGIIDMIIFEDFACRCLSACIVSLAQAATLIRKKTGLQLQGDLFLIRHLLILREQLVPFEIKLKSRHVEKKLDFRPTTLATKLLTSAAARSILRFDTTNSLIQWARDGLPGVEEMVLDAKQELDTILRNTCYSFKVNGLKSLLGQLEGFVVKINAFIDESTRASLANASSNTNNSNNNSNSSNNNTVYLGIDSEEQSIVQLPPEVRTVLKQQAFMKPERIKEMLLQVQESTVHATPDFRDMLKLYIENAVARTVLLKPIQSEILSVKSRIESAIGSCLDPGQTKRELEQLLKSIITTIMSELSR